MFSLQRTDVFPAGDLALRVALQRLKGVAQPLNEKQARELVAKEIGPAQTQTPAPAPAANQPLVKKVVAKRATTKPNKA